MLIHLRAAGSSLLLDARGRRVPAVVHWGRDLGDLDQGALAALTDAVVPAVPPSAVDQPLRVSLVPALHEGWSGRQGLAAFRAAGVPIDRLELVGLEPAAVGAGGGDGVMVTLRSADGGLTVSTEIELAPEGVLRARHTVRNEAREPVDLAGLDVVLPLPDRATEVLDLAGLWSHERRPQRTPLSHGTWLRETRHGRPGHDSPYLMMAGRPGFGFRDGEVWAMHVAWSGDIRLFADRQGLGATLLGGGEVLAPGEVRLPQDGTYTTPWVVAVWSAEGIDGLSDRLHPWLRRRSPVRLPRPVVLNTWEAVYFDHDAATLDRLVDAAADVGVERFVLDDGWFLGRYDETRALGDWTVDPQKWPHGLHPLVAHVHERGMDVGLWVEPEMVNPDSRLAREHPEWVLGPASTPTWRNQRVLDLDQQGAFDHVLGSLTALLTEYPITFLKWDHNRDLLTGSAHRQTAALYRLLDAVRRAFPDVEIESCASGGGRVDLGILEKVDRVWTSDTNDPLERQQIQRWTGVLVPPEYLGGHLGAATAHTTGRTSGLGFRLATALFGSAGIEWDLTRADAQEQATVRSWVDTYKAERGLLHSGVVVHADPSDPALHLHGVVSQDRCHALFALVCTVAPARATPAPVRFVGLDPDVRYTVQPLALGEGPRVIQECPPPWLASGPVTLSGRVLMEVGLAAPLLAAEQAMLFTVEVRP